MRHFFLFITTIIIPLIAEENFIVSDGSEILFEKGSQLDLRRTPACSFNIALSLMGFETGALMDETRPEREFQEGYDSTLESWKGTHTPLTWMKNSVVWYSRILAEEMGEETVKTFLNDFNYGNKDFSGGLTKAWISSSLKISPREQLHFIEKLTGRQLPVSERTFNLAKALLFKEEYGNGLRIYGKTGLGSYDNERGEKIQVGWLVGWLEKGEEVFPFAYNLQEPKINDQRLLRVKKLLEEIGFN